MGKFEIEGIEYELENFYDLEYTIQKMNEVLNRFGLEKVIRSQNFIRHLHLHIAVKLSKDLNIPQNSVIFEANLRNKKVDLAIMEGNQPKVLITIRSQTSSIKKNFTNNINSLQGEVVSLKTYYPDSYIALVFLLKRTDLSSKTDCLEYYNENIPKKLIPLINTSIPTKDRFDAALIIIWDIDNNGNIYLEKDNFFAKIYNVDNFLKDINSIISPQKITSQFSLSDLDLINVRNYLTIKS
ncbi:hypothetical protein D9V84_10015 [Bacteroidetes/Chlorobi group bacterium Naka2016]|jgi:hypothetical protein|nr:MAG: hypothetical protein D9V84_10015 [Bacteroidetes/Chlorobi group bacterium Naka2016]